MWKLVPRVTISSISVLVAALGFKYWNVCFWKLSENVYFFAYHDSCRYFVIHWFLVGSSGVWIGITAF